MQNFKNIFSLLYPAVFPYTLEKPKYIFLRNIILVLPLLALNSNLMSQVFVLSYYIKTLQSSDTLRPTSCQFSRYDNVDDDDERDHHG